jgi:hypothetical protein
MLFYLLTVGARTAGNALRPQPRDAAPIRA